MKSGNQALTFARYGLPVAAGVAGAGLAYGLYALAKAFGFAGNIIEEIKDGYKQFTDVVVPTISDEEYQEALVEEFNENPIGAVLNPTKTAQEAYEAYRTKKLAEQAQGIQAQIVNELIANADAAMEVNTSSWGAYRPFLSNTTGRSLYSAFGGFAGTVGSNPRGINNPQKRPPTGWPYYEPPNFDYNSLPDFGDGSGLDEVPVSFWSMRPDGSVAVIL